MRLSQLKAPIVLLTCALLAGTTMTAAASTPGFTVTLAATPDASGHLDVALQNVSASPITAFILFHSCSNNPLGRPSYSSVGFDALNRHTIVRDGKPTDISIPPGGSKHFTIFAYEQKCDGGASALFLDGHGEGSSDSLYGWRQLQRNRHIALTELKNISKLIEGIGAVPDFPNTLMDRLETRQRASMVSGRSKSEQAEAMTKLEITHAIEMYLRASQVPVELRTQAAALQLIDSWMAPLAGS